MMQGQEPVMAVKGDAKRLGSLDEKELSSLMRDPKYWREKDPAVIEKVTQGFRSIYGS